MPKHDAFILNYLLTLTILHITKVNFLSETDRDGWNSVTITLGQHSS